MKVPRNAHCPCGSGRKYKHCCGGTRANSRGLTKEDIRRLTAELEGRELQRRSQQGLGRPIVSALHKGYRFVAVANRVFYSKNWLTFHDFLLAYVESVFGTDWMKLEASKPASEQHPLLVMRTLTMNYLASRTDRGLRVQSAALTGAAAAYLGLAYNLYLMAHNTEVTDLLLRRLRLADQFAPAYYETFVAAAFIKAGFSVEPEDESDHMVKHCEFTAMFPATGRKFSVEAKRREPNKSHHDVGNQLYKALGKTALHDRVVFIEINAEPDPKNPNQVMLDADRSVRDRTAMMIRGQPAPPAYVVLTNHTKNYRLESTDLSRAILLEGYKVPGVRFDHGFASLGQALDIRERHAEAFALLQSLRTHYEIPSTFEGEIPEFEFGEVSRTLEIGRTYVVPTPDGERRGTLLNATVSVPEKAAFGVYRLEDGRQIIASTPLTEEELAVFRQYPDTFFGSHQPHGRHVRDAMDLYDFFHESYGKAPKERLLELMSTHPDIERLRGLTQKELARIYCERMAELAFAQRR